jgi:hypothetical protein
MNPDEQPPSFEETSLQSNTSTDDFISIPDLAEEKMNASEDTNAAEDTSEDSSFRAKKKKKPLLPPMTKKVVSTEAFVVLGVLLAAFVPIGIIMGFDNMLQTIFNNAFSLLIDTCFYLLAIAVVIGALSSVLSEFGIISLFNKALSPLMKPIYGMPGATSMAIFSSFLSDNPAVLTLAADRKFRTYFKKYQMAALTNIGTAFGMGLIVIVTMMVQKVNSGNLIVAVVVGLISAIIGSIFASRLMLRKAKKMFGTEEDAEPSTVHFDSSKYREIREGGVVQRLFSSLIDGGTSGVGIGLSIIPGVLIIANLVMLLSNGVPTKTVDNVDLILAYNGGAGQGVGLIPFIGEKLGFLFKFLFGFTSPDAISVPLTALGSAGAALGVIGQGSWTGGEIAVFTAMCMFWSGYLSTHVSMMDNMGFRKLTGSSILYHTFGGIVAGVSANVLYLLLSLLL